MPFGSIMFTPVSIKMTAAHPSTLAPHDLLGKVTDITDRVQTTFVRNDTKITDTKKKDIELVGVPLSLFSDLVLPVY